MTTRPAGTRPPADRKPRARKPATPPVHAAPVPDPRFEVIEDGDTLLYHSKRRGDLKLPLDIELGVLSDVIELGEDIDDPRKVIALLKALVGEDVTKLGTRELLPVFDRWSHELATAMVATPGESSSSPA